ncbi:hypothetical protein H6F86_10625 [Phormidium sp. FACHB-592]|uniref:Primase C-terminal 1 domain-containing protein n=1 Tax=Stenomitos frigidus AS-A4 TaxID=2933935 RepID=A0ABV0KRH2_9CYAN|nr:hypothetical protein [Phormidium sp. FACHB-592]MBD2074331.1 hypothetical protein [Phormidium sp. FACHB-592]
MNLALPTQFQSQFVQEPDAFLKLFPNRVDFIYAEHPDPGDRPDWKTEGRHPLSDRLLQEGDRLYGVRFGKQTDYLMLDIDRGSLYHPHSDRLAIPRLLAALEPLGLVEAVVVTSSYSGGIHLYLPFQKAQETWAIAHVVSTLLANAGFKLKPGQLELFPNPKPFSKAPSLYAAHRLPLQAGSYLLNSDFQPIYGEQTTFVQCWQFAQQRNEIDQRTRKRVLQQAKRKRYKLSGKAEKFFNDLNTEVEAGWSGASQTNPLLGRIAMREYIFGHVQRGSEPLTGEALVDAICEVARALPGFDTYCSHRLDLEKRAMSYARSIQASHYYPFGSKQQVKTALLPESLEPPKSNWNQSQSQAARDRINNAIADLQQRHALPATITARRHAIRAYGIGNQTLDKYKELWHPNYLKPIQGGEYHPVDADSINPESQKPIQGGEYHPVDTNKLVPHPAAPLGQAERQKEVRGFGGFSTGIAVAADRRKSDRAAQHLAKMQMWSVSGDPILVAEAQQFFTAQVLQESVSLVSTDVVATEPTEICPSEGVVMPGGFGRAQPQRRVGKTALQEVRQLSVVPQQPVREPDVTLAMQAEVAAFFAQYQQEHPEETALAWSAGVYNPLAKVDLLAVGARFLKPEEEDWLALARLVGWLLVEDELDAIYFTAPPPDFALEQADWYVRPDLTTFLESPVLLRAVVQQYPMTEASLRAAINQKVTALGWQPGQLEQFIQELFEKPGTALGAGDWSLLLFELQLQKS